MNIDPALLNMLVVASILLNVVSLGLFIYLLTKINKLLRGGDGKSIESAINKQVSILEELIDFRNKSVEYFKRIDQRIREKVSSKQAVRFNPFQDGGVGGNNSFSVALVDEEGNGSVLSSLHTRERTNVFIKPIQKWESQNDLSEEEEKSLGKTKKS